MRSGKQPVSYSVIIMDSFPQGKVATDHSPPSNAEVKNMGRFTYTVLYMYMLRPWKTLLFLISKDKTLTVNSSISKFTVIKNALHDSIVAVCSVTVSKPRENIIAIQYSIQQTKENL